MASLAKAVTWFGPIGTLLDLVCILGHICAHTQSHTHTRTDRCACPYFVHAYVPYTTNAHTYACILVSSLCAQLVSTMRNAWFHGATTKEETATRLQGTKPGSFLVRFSEQTGADPVLGFLAISFINRENQSLQHVRIQHACGVGYRVGEHVFPALSDLVAFFHNRNEITSPCPGSPYARIFGLADAAPVAKKEVGAYGEVDY